MTDTTPNDFLSGLSKSTLIAMLAKTMQDNAPSASPGPAKHKLQNVGGSTVVFSVVDTQTGQTKTHRLARREFELFPEAELEELARQTPNFFELGYFYAPTFVPPGPNVIPDIQEFLDSLTFETVEARIMAITSVDTLKMLFNYIEDHRYYTEDASGRELTERDADGKEHPIMKEHHLTPILSTVMTVLQRQVQELAGIRLVIN